MGIFLMVWRVDKSLFLRILSPSRECHSLANHLARVLRHKKERSKRQAVDISTIKKYWEYNCQFLGEDVARGSLEN